MNNPASPITGPQSPPSVPNRRARRSLRQPLIVGLTRTHQEILDRCWPGVKIVYFPGRKQYALQDRGRGNIPRGWHLITLFKPKVFPSQRMIMQILHHASVSRFKTEWERKRWYQRTFVDPEEEAEQLERQRAAEMIRREALPRFRSAMKHKVIVPRTK